MHAMQMHKFYFYPSDSLNCGVLHPLPLKLNFVPKFWLLSRRVEEKEILQILTLLNSFLTWTYIWLILCTKSLCPSSMDPYYPFVDFHRFSTGFQWFYYLFMSLGLSISDILALLWLYTLLSKILSTSLYDLQVVPFLIIMSLIRPHFWW